MQGTTFHRLIREYPPRLPEDELLISPPALLQIPQSGALAWLQSLIPLLLGSLSSVVLFIASRDNPLIIYMVVGVLAISAGLTVALRIWTQRPLKRQQQTQHDNYRKYLAEKKAQLRSLAETQRQVSRRLYPGSEQLAGVLQQRTSLWERRAEDQDFLMVRVGTGQIPLCRPVRLGVNSELMDRSKYDSALLTEAELLVSTYQVLGNEPYVIPLKQIGTLSIIGARSATRSLARVILSQVSVFHSPEDVRILTFAPANALHEWSWLKWLPHARRLRQVKGDRQQTSESLALLAGVVADYRELLLKQIDPELERRRETTEEKSPASEQIAKPHFILLLDGFSHSMTAQIPELEALLSDAARLGVTVICLVDDQSTEPASLQTRLTLSPTGELTCVQTSYGGRRDEHISADSCSVQLCESLARLQAPLSLADAGNKLDLSQDVRLLDLLGLRSAEAIRVPDTWKTRARKDVLVIPIGSRSNGEPLLLNLKESAEGGMGPHGLVIGTTGSGKSELLRTLVTGLAITHDPDTVNFVLADFKGGAAFAELAALPHVAGVITNLEHDHTLIDRMRDSLLGERNRRERLLLDAGKLDNIRQYHLKRQHNPEMAPLPHLVIIVDEFAQLLSSRPDFLQLFITIGQVGRSLGLHLLLATQRLDEGRLQGLESYLHYRICLRTFNKGESTTVIGTPNAYYLPSIPGVGYSKTGAVASELFKTALISSPYIPEKRQRPPAAYIREFTAAGKLVPVLPGTTRSTGSLLSDKQGVDVLTTEMDVVIERLARGTAIARFPRVHQVCLPPLPRNLRLEAVLDRCGRRDLDGGGWPNEPPFGSLCIPVGLLDKPLEQAQDPFLLDFSGSGGHLAIVGAPYAGKSILLRAIVASFLVTHSPRDVQFYCIDLGGGGLRSFAQAPHVGEVCSDSKREGEKIRRLVRQMRKILDDRIYQFREWRVENMAMYRTRRQAGEFVGEPFGDVFLVIDNLGQLLRDFDQIEADLLELVTNGLNYGVHVILATSRRLDIRPKLFENIGGYMELHLNDPTETAFKKAAAMAISAGIPGRGLIKEDQQFQAALPWVRSQNMTLQQSTDALVQRTRAAWKGKAAPPIRMLPERVEWNALPAVSSWPSGVPLGLEEFRLEPIYVDLLGADTHFLIFGDIQCGKTTLLRTWISGLKYRYTPAQAQIVIVDYRRDLLDLAEGEHLFGYACTSSMLKDCVEKLKIELGKRMPSGALTSLDQWRSRRPWEGPHYFMLVDDYETVVSDPAVKPLVSLIEPIQNARDVGLHLILARRVGGASRSFIEPVMQKLKEMNSPGIIMSGDPQEGVLVGTQRAALLPPGRGYYVRRGHPPTLVQVALPEPKLMKVN